MHPFPLALSPGTAASVCAFWDAWNRPRVRPTGVEGHVVPGLIRKIQFPLHGFQTLGFEETNFRVSILGQNQRLKHCNLLLHRDFKSLLFIQVCLHANKYWRSLQRDWEKALRIIDTNLIDMINGLFFVTEWKVKNHKTMITNAVCIVLDTLKVL